MRDDTPPPVEARSLTKHFSRFTAADAISSTINCGEIFGLMVPDDAGDYNLFDASVDAVGIYIPFPEPARMVATPRNGHPLAHIIVIQRGVFLRDLSFWLCRRAYLADSGDHRRHAHCGHVVVPTVGPVTRTKAASYGKRLSPRLSSSATNVIHRKSSAIYDHCSVRNDARLSPVARRMIPAHQAAERGLQFRTFLVTL